MKKELIGTYVILALSIAASIWLYIRDSNSWLVLAVVSLVLTIIFYQFLGGISQETSVSTKLFKVGGSAAVFFICYKLCASQVGKERDQFGLTEQPPRGQWVALDMQSGRCLDKIVIKSSDTTDKAHQLEIIQNQQQLNLALNITDKFEVWTKAGFLIGNVAKDVVQGLFEDKYRLFDIRAETLSNENPDPDTIQLEKFDLNISLLHKREDTLSYRIWDMKFKEAEYEGKKKRISTGEMGFFSFNNKKYFIGLLDLGKRHDAQLLIGEMD